MSSLSVLTFLVSHWTLPDLLSSHVGTDSEIGKNRPLERRLPTGPEHSLFFSDRELGRLTKWRVRNLEDRLLFPFPYLSKILVRQGKISHPICISWTKHSTDKLCSTSTYEKGNLCWCNKKGTITVWSWSERII